MSKNFVHIPKQCLVSKEVLLNALQTDTITNGSYTTEVCMGCGAYKMDENAPFPTNPKLLAECSECSTKEYSEFKS